MTENELHNIGTWLINNVFFNTNAMFEDKVRECNPTDYGGPKPDFVEITASLFNLLYKEVTGKEYGYFFHWANKIGGCLEENIFDEIMKGEKE